MVGNVVMIKQAENVPQSALAFARVFKKAGAPEGAYTNIFAGHDQVAGVIDDPRVRGATVTGSERAGIAVAERAGRALKKSVMELGGSDALIVLEDAPLEPTLANAMWGRMNNTGQSCVAAKRVIVVGKARGDAFLAGLTSGHDDHAATLARLDAVKQSVARDAGEPEHAYSARLEMARGEAIGLARHTAETTESFGERIGHAMAAVENVVMGVMSSSHSTGRCRWLSRREHKPPLLFKTMPGTITELPSHVEPDGCASRSPQHGRPERAPGKLRLLASISISPRFAHL